MKTNKIMENKNTDQDIEDILIPEESQDQQVTSDEIKDYINQNSTEAQDTNDEPQEESKEDEDENRLTIDPPKTYDTKPSKYYDMSVPVQDYDHIVTQEDKEAYLDAMMEEVDLHLHIKMKNGITITCRDLNMYERELSLELAKKKLKDQKVLPHMGLAILRSIRLPMQIVQLNNKKFKTIRFEYNPDATQEQFELDMEQLSKKSKEVMMRIPSSLDSLYTKALNIFEHKLARLEEAAFNEDFWNPVERD